MMGLPVTLVYESIRSAAKRSILLAITAVLLVACGRTQPTSISTVVVLPAPTSIVSSVPPPPVIEPATLAQEGTESTIRPDDAALIGDTRHCDPTRVAEIESLMAPELLRGPGEPGIDETEAWKLYRSLVWVIVEMPSGVDTSYRIVSGVVTSVKNQVATVLNYRGRIGCIALLVPGRGVFGASIEK